MSAMTQLVVGITGHRPNRLAMGEAATMQRLREVLGSIRDGAAGGEVVALSALAEGADRLFAEAAVALEFRLEAILPFPQADYETTFGDTATTPAFRRVLASARHVEVLPGSLADTRAAYEAQGRAIVDASDIVVAVWDGKPAAGRGGTPEIIAYAVAGGHPVIWIDAATDRSPMLLRKPAGAAGHGQDVQDMAAAAAPVAPADIAALCRAIVQQT
jgi:hypothetical protein